MGRRVQLGIAATLAISCGTDSVPPDQTAPFEPVAPAVYVAKVKNILVGLPPTDAEVAAVVANPTALGGLIDGWMTTPEYQAKMMVFFELAFQQTQITSADFLAMIPPVGLLNGAGLPLLTQNASQSFARTVLQLQAEGRPLTEGFTTKRVMMTPALMALYGFLDARTVDNDGLIRDSFQRDHAGLKITLQAAAGPVPIADTMNPASPNFMHWYNPDLPSLSYNDTSCKGQDPITFNANSLALIQMMYGEIPNHQSATGAGCANRPGGTASVQFSATDFTTWTMVTIRPPNSGEATTPFWDLPVLRAKTELVLRTPHPGFFTTPAFAANWATNSSNQHRVTLNQALIVATGAQVDGSDPTIPTSTPGLDAVHATEACIGCHQLLDPTRSIFSSTYSWFDYPATDPALIAQPGLFAFEGVIQPMHTIDDFATLLATHPLVPTAWAQKLCYYANSAPCDPNDPELERVVSVFTNSGMSWNTLVRELLASPITTYASHTVTADTNGEVVGVARRDHLCSAIDSRLGLSDICQLDATLVAASRTDTRSTIAQIVSGLPSDGYGRGATAPVLPNEATLFYRAGLENICSELAATVIDATANASQPNAKKWSSAQPDTAIADFVGTVMGLSASDERSAQAKTLLRSHFDSAKTTGASATDSLRSTFVVACLSPSFIGIGL